MPSLSTLIGAERRAKIAADLPGQIEACKCQVEFPAVKELTWTWLWD
jgi:hypothetical protein